MSTLWHSLDQLPIWPRLTLAGLFWGMFCGVGAAIAAMLAMFTAGVAVDGLDWQGLPTLIVGVIVCLGVGGGLGATLGGLIGALTGVLGGAILLLLLRFARPGRAVFTTVLVVSVIQLGAGVLLFEGVWIGLALAAPVLGVVPMTLTALGASHEWTDRRGTQVWA